MEDFLNIPETVLAYSAYSYFEKVVGKNVHATIPKSNMGYDQYTVPDCSCQTYFCCFPLLVANICPWPLEPFFQISLKNSELKATHNTFRDYRVHFFRQPFSKLYTLSKWAHGCVNAKRNKSTGENDETSLCELYINCFWSFLRVWHWSVISGAFFLFANFSSDNGASTEDESH